ncbi:MAG TPA: ATP-binding protein [Nitrospirota bacterium]
MKQRSIKGRAAFKSGIAGVFILLPALAVYEALSPYNLVLAALLSVLMSTLSAALTGYLVGAYEIWEFKKLAEVGAKAEKGEVSWEDAISWEDSPDEVRAVQEVMRALKQKMDDAVLSQKRFLADASHEMRSPLTIMKGDIEIALRRERTPDEYRAILDSNLEEIDRMEFLVKDLMFLARSDSSELVMNMAPAKLCDVLSTVCARLTPMAIKKGIELEYDSGCSGEALVTGDPDRLTQLFVNLVENALRYTPEGGSVKVDLRAIAGIYRVDVTDTGIGIPENELERIFDRFYRVDKARARESGGSGLGLCICKWIVESHLGDISIESREGAGTKVTVMFLPASA